MEIRRRPERVAPTVLVLDRLGTFHSFAQEVLAPQGYRVLWGESPPEVISALEGGRVDAVLVDVCVPHQGLLDGVESVIRTRTGARMVVVTGCPLMDAAARVLYPEADGFLQKPCPPEELRSQVAGRPDALSSHEDPGLPFHRIVGTSPGIRRVIEQIQEVAPTESTILVTGETGTGKELVAAAIHECSHRRDRPYVVVDTVALSETLLEVRRGSRLPPALIRARSSTARSWGGGRAGIENVAVRDGSSVHVKSAIGPPTSQPQTLLCRELHRKMH
jgi:DNA-binding NtrC family response regulator